LYGARSTELRTVDFRAGFPGDGELVPSAVADAAQATTFFGSGHFVRGGLQVQHGAGNSVCAEPADPDPQERLLLRSCIDLKRSACAVVLAGLALADPRVGFHDGGDLSHGHAVREQNGEHAAGGSLEKANSGRSCLRGDHPPFFRMGVCAAPTFRPFRARGRFV